MTSVHEPEFALDLKFLRPPVQVFNVTTSIIASWPLFIFLWTLYIYVFAKHHEPPPGTGASSNREMWVWLQHESANVGWAWFSNEHVAASVITITNLMVILCVFAHVSTCHTLQHHTHKQKSLILSYVLDYLLEFESLGYTLVQLMSTFC